LTKPSTWLQNERVRTKTVPIRKLLANLLRERNLRASHLAAAIGVSHATVGRWLKGEDIPTARSCYRLAEFSGIPIEDILRSAGHIPEPAMELSCKHSKP
jgi:transcriptional regulator with XRE-family HTH domain